MKKRYQTVLGQVRELETLAAVPGRLAISKAEVSRWSVGQHADHLAKAGAFMILAIRGSLEEPAKDPHLRPTRIGRVVLWTGFIPRGRGKAPERSIPGDVAPEALAGQIRSFREGLVGLEGKLGAIASSRGRVKHPALGWFSAAEWLRMMEVHHRHHMKIVRDIERHR